ncbi:MAG TPA: transcription antitermination factor NusB [Xanthomonadales bacterium]|nr:transcription antitermination factor NusB [Xanthomonadales bacterium]
MTAGTNIQERKRARRRALQAIYQWQLKDEVESAEYLIEQFLDHQDFSQVDQAYFELLVRGVIDSAEGYDKRLEPFLDRPMSDVDQMERVILRLGAYELLENPELPFRIIVDEAVDLSHRFGAEQGHAFVNGVLDKAARDWRPKEFS